MRRFATVAFAVAVLLSASFALAGPPLEGNWDSTDIGGPIYTGRYTEAYPSANGALSAGTVLNAESWDGSNLGTQWRYWCSTIQAEPVLLSDNVTDGTGFRIYMKTFVGGYLWLNGSGPWANGDTDYPGVIDTYVETETIQYLNGERIHAITNVSAVGHFDLYPEECMTFVVGNGVEIGSTDFGQTKPSDYPGFLDETTCDPTATLGGWWNFITLSMYVHSCSVPTEETSWGAVKAIYAE